MTTRTSCQQVVREVSRYFEGSLPGELHTRVERHLRRCGQCAIVLSTTQKLLAVVADDRVFAVPGDDDGWRERFLENLKRRM